MLEELEEFSDRLMVKCEQEDGYEKSMWKKLRTAVHNIGDVKLANDNFMGVDDTNLGNKQVGIPRN